MTEPSGTLTREQIENTLQFLEGRATDGFDCTLMETDQVMHAFRMALRLLELERQLDERAKREAQK